MKRAVVIVLIFVAVSFAFSPTIVRAETKQEKLARTLAYLKKIPEITWISFEGNSVYIGWKERPGDIRAVVGAAAFHGNRAINFGVHLYNYDASRFPRPTNGPLFFCTATVRHGKHKNNDC